MMKHAMVLLVAALAGTLTAAASPLLQIETTITETHAKGRRDVLAAPRLVVESGKQASIQIGTLEYRIAPTLLKDGTVELRTTLIERQGQKVDRLAAPRTTAKLGQVAEVQVGNRAFSMRATRAR